MRLSIQRLRGGLISGAVLLVLVLAAYIGYGRYKAFLFYRNILKKNGITFTHDSNGITFSQSLEGKTVFTLRAARATPMGSGKWKLHNAELTLYGRGSQDAGKRADHISSAEIEWDETDGVARALGEVHMDLQAPQALSGRPAAAPTFAAHAESPETIHVRTSGLVYLRKLGVAATDQPVEFRYANILCTARGAEFNSGESNLHLLANVVLDGQRQGNPIHLTAQRADLDRTTNVANLLQPVVVSQGRSARSNTAEINFRNDGSLQHLLARGDVKLTGTTQQIASAELQAAFNTQSVAQTATLTGGVTLSDANAQRPVNGAAHQLDILFTPQGSPATVTATGAAHLSMLDRRSVAAGLTRQMQGDRIVAHFVPGPRKATGSQTTQLSAVEAIGSASAHGDSLVVPGKAAPPSAPQRKTTEVAADDLRLLFVPSETTAAATSTQPHQLFGTGHTRLQQDAPGNAQQVSTGDILQVNLTRAATTPMAIESAIQSGHVAVHIRAAERPGTNSPPAVTTATADRAAFDGTTERVTLTGSARLTNLTSELLAASVTLDQRAQTADASGHVETTFINSQSNAQSNSQSNSENNAGHTSAPTHILSASAHFEREGRLAAFHGTDAAPARIWQLGSQVQAANLLFDGDRRTFSARPAAPGTLIHAVFAATPAPSPRPAPNPTPTGAAPLHSSATVKPRSPSAGVVRVASPRMDYSDLDHEAVFAGTTPDSVQVDSTSGRALAARAVVFLTPAEKSRRPVEPTTAQPNPLSGSLDRIILSGGVQLLQPSRRGTGEQLLYTAATGSYVLTGTPTQSPHIVDAQQGSLTGTQLLFSDAGSTIVVTGTPPSSHPGPASSGRVHTETPMKPSRP